MPPTLGGKSFVTMRVLGISTGWISSQRMFEGQGVLWDKEGRTGSATGGSGGAHAHSRCSRAGVSSPSRGTDARAWLHDLVTADVEGMPDRGSRRSLLLTPTGRIRADFHVAAVDGSFLLLQAPEQPEGVDAILRPYVLSSDVQVEDRTDGSVVAVLGDVGVAEWRRSSRPDAVGAGPGRDLVVATEASRTHRTPACIGAWSRWNPERPRDVAHPTRGPADGSRFRTGRLAGRGGSRGRDRLHEGMLPRAGIRCQGPQPRSSTPCARARSVRRAHRSGDASVLAGEETVGEVTSVAAALRGVDAIVRVRWDAARERLATEAGPLVLQNGE